MKKNFLGNCTANARTLGWTFAAFARLLHALLARLPACYACQFSCSLAPASSVYSCNTCNLKNLLQLSKTDKTFETHVRLNGRLAHLNTM
jgi:hypothetical protein